MQRLCANDVMAEKIFSVSPELSLLELLCVAPQDPLPAVARLMRDRRIHRVLVLEGERLVGMVSSFDIVRAVAEQA